MLTYCPVDFRDFTIQVNVSKNILMRYLKVKTRGERNSTQESNQKAGSERAMMMVG